LSQKEEKETHLGFIQGVINRMANNSFLIKGWSIALITAIIIIPNNNKLLPLCSIIVLIALWWMDSFFLYNESLYRKLYEKVANGLDNEYFSMNAHKYKKEIDCLFKVFFSKTLFFFYISIIIFMVALFLISTSNILNGY